MEGQLAFSASFQALHLLQNNPKEIIQKNIASLKASIGSSRPMGYSQNIVQNVNSTESPEWFGAGYELGTAGLLVRHADHSGMLPPD